MLADDPELLATFLDEAQESLDGIEAEVIALSRAADLRSAVDDIFRPVHTLKGNAPFFGLMQVQRLAHALETLLDRLRQGRCALSDDLVQTLLTGLDRLRSCILSLRDGGEEVPDEAAHEAQITLLNNLSAGGGSDGAWQATEAELERLELHPNLPAAIAAGLERLRLALEGLRPGAAPAASTTATPSAAQDDLVTALRLRLSQALSEPLDAEAGAEVLSELQTLRARGGEAEQLDEVIATVQVFLPTIGFDDTLRRHVLEALEQLELAADPAPANTDGTASRQETSTRRRQTQTESQGRSMRVSEAAVDGFLAHVGDLLVIGDQLEHLALRMARLDDGLLLRDMRQAVASFGLLSGALQRSIMTVRRVPLRSLLQKAPRLVRDIAISLRKQIEVVLEGESIEVDKSRLDLLDGPLTHIVRNSADHGIESPEQRRAANKPESGTITICAASDEGWFRLSISDDGRGLDLEAIRRKGEAQGLVRPGESLDEATIVDLIFSSGLSTAEQVSDVSGRGVGMDVVRRAITEAGGDIGIQTEAGAGTTVTLRVPTAVATQIISAYLVQEGEGIFAIPLDRVRECFAQDGQDSAKAGPGIVRRHERILPLLPLGHILDHESAAEPDSGSRQSEASTQRRILVQVERRGSPLVLSVDGILGVRQVVVRPMSGVGNHAHTALYKGAALLGDGRLALVLDLDLLPDPREPSLA